MAKSFVYGNGSIAVGLDLYGQVYDVYFPYVGLENHTGGSYVHKIGVWIDGIFHWTDDGTWEISCDYYDNGEIDNKLILKHNQLKIKIEVTDEVYNELNIFLRSFKLFNLSETSREIKLYFNQQFEIYESHRGDTAYYDPKDNVVIHYKGRRIFLANAINRDTKEAFNEYSVGLFGIEGKLGTYKDAEDGKLEKNPIEHGLTDSVIGLSMNIEPNGNQTIDYWLAISKNMNEVKQLNEYVLKKTPDYLITTTKNYWKAWSAKKEMDFKDLTLEEQALFKQSLKMLRVHTDTTGAIIASSDTDLLKYGRDAYSYVWPRDAAFTSMAYARAGYDDINKNIINFFNDIITPEGYFMHKYRSDKSLGSSWHPWVYKGVTELPIQLDETALVVNAIWSDYKYSRDIEYLEKIYNSLLRKAIDFIISRIDTQTGLVKPSYDLWEEHFGTFTFTSSTVYGALQAASEMAEVFGKKDKKEEYMMLSKLVKNGILNYHYNSETKTFYKRIIYKEHSIDGIELKDDTADMSSLYGLFRFKVLESDDERLINMKKYVQEKLQCSTPIGGMPRYENDRYFKVTENVQGNPWVITTMWMAQLCIAQSKSLDELKKCRYYIDWANSHASNSGILSEQLDPTNGMQISASPLTWSHTEYIITVLDYIEKYEQLSS
ncbi:glycoside hydrolase family 15 protein [Candidatus Dojkabacteria bacterium]|uniref:Glycoside hydrolase family 15 protein n=1 Tax=Candidatus Dojkabacteria bacterium TaxID=2099670 RepID=A0A955LA47_9BACT|nr:glycoside hydrolase family 15 protein [Candidatus Dojkabacteria bacterium]